MARELKRVPADEIAHALDAVINDGEPRVITRNGEEAAVLLRFTRRDRNADLWAAYSADTAREALKAGTGALAGVDRGRLLSELREARGQYSAGRPE